MRALPMSYDIPDEIQYREKIVFGLDLKQLCYFCFFGVFAFLSYNLSLEGGAKLVLPAILGSLGAGFIFLNLEEKLLDTFHYYSGVRKASPFSTKAQQLVGIRAIENNQILLMDGNLRAILQIEPINFSLLDEGQKKAFVSNYREFLNHLTDPIQILVRTEKSDAEEVFRKAQESLEGGEKEIAALFRDFFEFERTLMESQHQRERRYYLIVTQQKAPSFGGKADDAKEREKLEQKAKIMQEKLSACGLKSRRLETKELLRFFATYSMSENAEEEKEEPKKKQEKQPENFLIEVITPDFDITPKHARVNGTYHRIVKAVGYPRNVEDAWLEQFMATSEPYDVSLHIHPATISSILVRIHRQIIKQTSDLLSSSSAGTPNPALEIKRKDTMKVYGLLYKGKEKIFNVSLYVDCQAENLRELELMSERCKANMNALLIVPKEISFRMADGIRSMLPIGMDALGAQREFLTSSLCATFPFLYPVDSRKEGIFFAHERNTLNPLFIDFGSMSNKHFFVLGISGSGKSYAAKFLLMQHILAREPKIYILDPNAEYANLVERLGGTEIVLSKDSDKVINLFELAGEDFGSKMLTLISVFDIITGGLTESQKGVLNDALVRVYKKMGITAENPSSWNRKAPTFSDLKGILEDMKYKVRRRLQSPEEKSIEVLLNRVKMYSKGGFFGFLDRGTKVDLKSGMLDFDLSSLPPQVKQLVMFSVLELLSREIRKDKKPKLVLIDEGWSLLRSKEAENYILEFIKTSRKFNASIGFITQEIEDLLRSEGGKSILNTTSTKILLRQNSSNLDLISKTLALNEKERDYLLRAERGQGLMISEQGRYEFIVRAPPLIHSLITTDPNEKGAVQLPKKKEKKKKEPSIDTERGFYFEKELNDNQKDTLLASGYVYHRSLVFDKCGSHNLLVRKQPPESPEHSALCWAIAEEMRKHGGKPVIMSTVGADVSVEIGKKRICFEVETGLNVEGHGEEHVKQKMVEIRKECSRLIVVVTDRKMKNLYSRLAQAEAITRTEVPERIAKLFR